MLAILNNQLLISSLLAWFAAQFSKVITGKFRHEKLNIRKLIFATGGMPSSHSAMVAALCTASGIKYGVSSFQFASTFVLAMIVMCDAAGLRKAVGEQAKTINKMTNNIFGGNFEKADLKELIGHTPFQVVMGMVTGIISAFILCPLY